MTSATRRTIVGRPPLPEAPLEAAEDGQVPSEGFFKGYAIQKHDFWGLRKASS